MVNIYKLKLTLLQQEVLRFLFVNAGMAFNARTLAIGLEVSQPAISKALPSLEKEGYIKVKKDKESKRLSIELNRDNPLVAGLKRAENLKIFYESGLAEYLSDSFPGCTIMLFGSYSMGEDTIGSDVDIAVIGTKGKELEFERFEKMLKKRIIVQFYPNFKDINKHLKENIFNGILIKGGIEL